MQQIKDMEFSGERPLFASHDLQLDNVVIHAGESALKECSNIIAIGCRFEGKYPFWHVDGFTIKNSLFTEGGRAALWYSQNLVMMDTRVEAPKMFREMDGIRLENVQLPNAQETLWHCRNVELINVQIDHADYLFMHGENIKIRNYAQNGTTRSSIVRTWKSVMRSSTRKTLSGIRRMLPYTIPRLTASTWMALEEPAFGKLQNLGYTAALLRPRSYDGELYDGR